MKKFIIGIDGICIKNKVFEEYIYLGCSNSIHDRFFKNGHRLLIKKGAHSSFALNNANN